MNINSNSQVKLKFDVMKKKIVLSVMVISVLSIITTFGNSKTEKIEKFKVNGTCGTCENRIEKAAKSVDGVKSADWNVKTKMMVVNFDDSKTDVHKVEIAIANAGHDTEMHKAPHEAYSKLSGCCKYDRTKTDKKMNDKMKMAPAK